MVYEPDETYEPFRDGTYRAIGRYVVEFSRIFALMRDKMSYRLARPEDTREPLQTALGEMTAAQLTNAFFASCASIGQLDDEERQVGRWLRARLIKESERRNDIAHGDWVVAQVVNTEPRRNISELRRIKPAKPKDADHSEDMLADKLDKWAHEAHDLGLLVAEFGQLALGLYINDSRRVRDVFRIENKRLVRHT